ncbi:MAG: DUF1800 family protein [Actinomycetota bacterium]
MSVPATPSNAAHLLRRAAWGGRPSEVARVVDDGIEASVARLLDPATAPTLDEPKATPGFVPYEHEALVAWLVRAAATSSAPAIERLAWFWHGHFATSIEKVELTDLMLRHYLTLRRLGLGRFDDLLAAMAGDAAMNLWLDLHLSVAGNPNENFAREVLELFSMGAGNGYTQRDVVEAARAFTGYGFELDPTYERIVGSRLVPTLHDRWAKTFLGRTGDLDGLDVIEIVVGRPECHRFLAERFWLRYAGTTPPDGAIGDLAAAFAARLEIRDLLGALLTHPAFYADDVKGGLVGQPVEVVIRTIRGFELDLPDLTTTTLADIEEADERHEDGDEPPLPPGTLYPWEVFDWLETLGQLPLLPPNVGGWPHNEAWLDTNRSAGRLLAGTELGYRLANGDGPVSDELRRAAAAGSGPLTEAILTRFGRESWSAETADAIAIARADGEERGLAAAIAVAFTSPEVILL